MLAGTVKHEEPLSTMAVHQPDEAPKREELQTERLKTRSSWKEETCGSDHWSRVAACWSSSETPVRPSSHEPRRSALGASSRLRSSANVSACAARSAFHAVGEPLGDVPSTPPASAQKKGSSAAGTSRPELGAASSATWPSKLSIGSPPEPSPSHAPSLASDKKETWSVASRNWPAMRIVTSST